jgi:ubiquinone/menaquinone biosynthesis C-methylase UbiE
MSHDERLQRPSAYYARPEVVDLYRSDGSLSAAELQLVDRHVAADASVLDVGTGAGRVALALARSGRRATGLDRSPQMLAAARDAAERLGLDVPFVEGDAADLPFDDGAFDATTFLCNGIGHLDLVDKRRCLAEMQRVTRPGGHVLLSVRSPYAVNRLLPGLLVRTVAETGRRVLGRTGPSRDEQLAAPAYVHRPSVRTMERLIGEAGLELVESTSLYVLGGGRRVGPLTRYVGGQFFLVARSP